LSKQVNQTQKEIIITKNGKPISRLVPYSKQLESLFGLHQSLVKSVGDLLALLGESWGADA
jgi:prevent-host-death family protein